MTSYTKYLSTTAVYCNDRTEQTAGTYNTGTTTFYYAPYARVRTNYAPTYDCTNINDKFTVDSSTGNGKLTYPIALMTADEVSFAGGRWAVNALTWYHYNSAKGSSTGETLWWLMSPTCWRDSSAGVSVTGGSSYPGYLSDNSVINSGGVRPAISLKSCTKWASGDGSSSNPYTIQETASGC